MPREGSVTHKIGENHYLYNKILDPFTRAIDLILAHPLRAYDAVQLASALVLPLSVEATHPTFISADEVLLSTARELGLATDNPNLYP